MPYLKVIIGVQAGVLIGGLAVWAGTYSNSTDLITASAQPVSEQLALLQCYSHMPIQAEYYNCSDIHLTGLKPTVGDVIASIMSANLTSVSNRQSFDCIDNVCSLSVTDCKPWQSNECSTRFLKYELDKDQQIKPDSFNCIDVP